MTYCKPTHIDPVGHYWRYDDATDKWYCCTHGAGWVSGVPPVGLMTIEEHRQGKRIDTTEVEEAATIAKIYQYESPQMSAVYRLLKNWL